MKDQAATEVSDEDFARRAERWPRDTPDTKEAYWIREIFDGASFSSSTPEHILTLHPGLFPSDTAAETAVR